MPLKSMPTCSKKLSSSLARMAFINEGGNSLSSVGLRRSSPYSAINCPLLANTRSGIFNSVLSISSVDGKSLAICKAVKPAIMTPLIKQAEAKMASGGRIFLNKMMCSFKCRGVNQVLIKFEQYCFQPDSSEY